MSLLQTTVQHTATKPAEVKENLAAAYGECLGEVYLLQNLSELTNNGLPLKSTEQMRSSLVCKTARTTDSSPEVGLPSSVVT